MRQLAVVRAAQAAPPIPPGGVYRLVLVVPYIAGCTRFHTSGWFVIKGRWYASEASMRRDYPETKYLLVEDKTSAKPDWEGVAFEFDEVF